MSSGGGAEIDGGVGIEQPRDLRDVRRFSHEAMATVYEVYAVHADRQYAAQAAQAAFDLVDRLERELSRFLPNSDITRINHLDRGESTRVAPSTLECLVIARHMFDLTGGAFDREADELVLRFGVTGDFAFGTGCAFGGASGWRSGLLRMSIGTSDRIPIASDA